MFGKMVLGIFDVSVIPRISKRKGEDIDEKTGLYH